MRRAICVIGGLAAFLLLSACARTVNTVDVRSDGSTDWIQTDPILSESTYLTGVRKAKEGDLLRVQVNIVNRRDAQQIFIYRFVWLDARGMEFKTPLTTWERKFIEGQQQMSLTGIAPDASVTDCRLELRRADAN